jgi:MFS family permease
MTSPRSIIPRTVFAFAALNFFLADARDGLGPFLDAYMITNGWTPVELGVLATLGGTVGLLLGTPAGAFVDASPRKRSLICIPVLVITLLAFCAIAYPSVPVVFTTQIVTALLGLTIGPALMGITLGVMGRENFGRQVSRNESWNHGGNIVLLFLTYFASRLAGLEAVATLMVVTTTATILATLALNPKDIHHDVARGFVEDQTNSHPSSLLVLASNRPLILLGLVLMLFHFGNAPIARLIAQQFALKLNQPFQTTAIITAVGQVSALLAALSAPWLIGKIGLRGTFLIALSSLPLRGAIAASSAGFFVIYPVQALDGLGAGMLGILTPIAVEKILEGSGRFNLGLAGVLTLQGIGATSSNIVAGYLVQDFGFATAYIVHGSMAAMLAIVAFLTAFPPQSWTSIEHHRNRDIAVIS